MIKRIITITINSIYWIMAISFQVITVWFMYKKEEYPSFVIYLDYVMMAVSGVLLIINLIITYRKHEFYNWYNLLCPAICFYMLTYSMVFNYLKVFNYN